MREAKGIGGHQSINSRTDEWLTPREVMLQMGEFDLDPCSPIERPWNTAKKHYTIIDNGLILPWFGRVWLNPPYGKELELWMALMASHNNGMALIFARTDTDAFHKYVFPVADSIFFLKRRISFCNTSGMKSKSGSGAPSVFIAYGEYDSQVLSETKLVGRHVPLNYTPMIIVGVSPTWISVVSIAVRNFGDKELKPVYEMVERIAPDKVAANQHWKAKIRQVIQVIRNKKTLSSILETDKQTSLQ